MQLSRCGNNRRAGAQGKLQGMKTQVKDQRQNTLKMRREPDVRGDMKGLPCVSGIIKMRGKTMNLTALSALNCSFLAVLVPGFLRRANSHSFYISTTTY